MSVIKGEVGLSFPQHRHIIYNWILLNFLISCYAETNYTVIRFFHLDDKKGKGGKTFNWLA